MSVISNNKYDMFNWVEKIIGSYKTLDHTNGSDRL
jgi:hypothetical protein